MKVVFLLFSCLTEKIEFMLLCLYIKYFSVERDLFFWAGGLEKYADTNLKENCSVVLSMTISALGVLILCLGEVLHLFEIQ